MISNFIFNKRYSFIYTGVNPDDYSVSGTNSYTYIFADVTYLKINGEKIIASTNVQITFNFIDVIGDEDVKEVNISVNGETTTYPLDVSITLWGKAVVFPNLPIWGGIITDNILSNTDLLVAMSFYQLEEEKNNVSKSTTLSRTPFNLYGQFETEISLINPVFIIQYDNASDVVFKYNYLYIENLNRYYFIDEIINVRKGIWKLSCSVDVLKSFETDIKKQNALVTRQENETNSGLVDIRRPLEDIRDISFTIPTKGTYTNTDFSPDWVEEDEQLYYLLNPMYVVTIFNDYFSDILDSATRDFTAKPPAGITGLPEVSTPIYGNTKAVSYLMTPLFEKTTEKYIFEHAADSTYVMSIVAFPFDLSLLAKKKDDDPTTDATIRPKINDEYISDTASNVSKYTLLKSTGYVVVEDFTITSPYSDAKKYLNYEPYNNYEFFIPYYGWVKMNPIDILDKRIILYYVADIYTGNATAYLYNTTDSKLLWSSPCQLGVSIPINTDNKEEINARKQANTSNLLLGIIGSAVGIGIGAATGGIGLVGAAGGMLTGAKSIANFINNNAMMFERANVSLPDSNSSLYTGQRLVIKRSYLRTNPNVDEDVYKHMQGYPLNAYRSISLLTGYTEIGEIHYKPDTQKYITNNEIEMIESIVKDGILL